jgi:hypothetical protein
VSKPITLDKAKAAYRAVCAALDEQPSVVSAITGDVIVYRQGGASWPTGPVLVEDFEDSGHYAVVYEGGPYEWAWLVSQGETDEFGHRWPKAEIPAGVHTECVFSFALGLYPA